MLGNPVAAPTLQKREPHARSFEPSFYSPAPAPEGAGADAGASWCPALTTLPIGPQTSCSWGFCQTALAASIASVLYSISISCPPAGPLGSVRGTNTICCVLAT